MRTGWLAAVTMGALLALPSFSPASMTKVLDFSRGGAGDDSVGEITGRASQAGWRYRQGGEELGGMEKLYEVPLTDEEKALGKRGSLSFVVTRGNDGNEIEALASFTAGEESFVVFEVHWENDDSKLPFIAVLAPEPLWSGKGGDYAGAPPPPTFFHFPKRVATGETFRLTFTWGPSRGDSRIYFNDRPLDVDPGVVVDMTEILQQAEALAIGGEKDGDGVYSRIRSPLHQVAFSSSSSVEAIVAPAAEAAVESVDHDGARVAGFSGTLVPGDKVTVTMKGTPGGAATFDVARRTDRFGEIPVSWKGWGVYLEEKVFFDDGEIDLRDVEEYRVYAQEEPFGAITVETPFVEELEVEQQSYVLEGLKFETPYYVAVMALMDDGSLKPVLWPEQNLAMTEEERSPGTYEGTFTVDYGDLYPEAVVVARISGGDSTAILAADEFFEIDGRLTLAVAASPSELKADEKSQSKVTVTVTDANGEPVTGHEIRFLLATTSQYTGVVGGGAFADQVGGNLERSFRGETDLFGRASATYTAGFAAKTAIIVARDMTSNDTGAGYVKTYINAAAELELEAVQVVAGKALGYAIMVTSSDEWLTADGESEARITALVTKDGIPVEGHRVGFQVTSGTGSIRVVDDTTGSDGKARAIYTAGKKIGIVLITAVDHTIGISGSVQIELRSDAPAKIAIVLEKDLLPADGRSTSGIEVTVTDINDNPNEGVEVEYAVGIGSGRLRRIEDVTDSDGVSTAEYVAGTIPGRVSIEVTVRSTVPTDEELLAARDLATAVLDYDFY